tara:strand:- start:701 stop:2281 length:1581 start_codon:yes stop_codon:yes gene_type:complete
MAMNQQGFHPEAPEFARSRPDAYYAWLTSNGFPHQVAYDQTTNIFGAPKTPEQIRKEQAAAAQRSGLAQTGGMVGGALLTQEALRGFPNVKGAFATPNYAESGTITTTRPVPPPTTKVDGSGAVVDVSTAPVTEVGSTTMPDGSPGTLMSDGGKIGQNGKIVNPDGSPGGSFTGQAVAGLQVAGGAAQAYNGYKQYQAGEKLGGAANIAGGAYTTAAGAQSLAAGGTAGSLAGYVPYVGTAVAAAQVGQEMLNEKGSSGDRAAKAQAEAQKAAMLWIPGYGWVAYAAIAGLDAITGGMATKGLVAYNKTGAKITDKFDLGLGKNLRARAFHQSTKGVQEMHTGQLLQQSEDPTWQNYVVGMRAQVKEGPKDKEKPFAGKYKTFDEYKKAGLQANDLTGVYGNLDAFKPAYADKAGMPNWAKLTFDQQKAVTQRLINEDMYSSKKGEVVIKDKEKARRIYEGMAGANFGVASGQNSQKDTNVVTAKKGEVARQSAGLYRNDAGKLVAAPTMRGALQKAYSQSKEKKK